jgi:hypothetical protein
MNFQFCNAWASVSAYPSFAPVALLISGDTRIAASKPFIHSHHFV